MKFLNPELRIFERIFTIFANILVVARNMTYVGAVWGKAQLNQKYGCIILHLEISSNCPKQQYMRYIIYQLV